MNRYTRQGTSKNRRVLPCVRDVRQDAPHLSAYLALLGRQVNRAAPAPSDADISSGGEAPAIKQFTSADAAAGAAMDEDKKSFFAIFSLGMWGFYFLAKLGMYWMGLIAFHPLENLVFATFILLPAASRPWRRIKSALAVVLALALLYYDSWLPSVSRVISQATWWSDFTFAYLFDLLTRFISWPVVGALLVIGLVYWFISRRLHVGVLVIVGMMILGIVQSPIFHDLGQTFKGREQVAGNALPDMDQVVTAFFDKESQRKVAFTRPAVNAVPFDVIFIHVCSLSWDDISAVGLEQHPLWQRFDILLKKFNSDASYSAPAAIHLLRATCGQQEHDKVYFPVPDNCYLMSGLQASGFEPNLALNFTGNFDNFLDQVQTHGRLTAPLLTQDGLDVAQYAFNNAPIYDDLAMLNRWLVTRQKSRNLRVALFYNTISLHDGNHFPGTDAAPNTLKTYKVRLVRFLDEMEKFMQELDDSGRRAVVVMVPEHGAAVRGDKRQIPGLREIPTPAITLVPVGIKVIGGHVQRAGGSVSVDQPTSYLAIAHIVARMLEKSPFTNNSFVSSDYVAGLPITPFVAQTDKMTVAEYNHRFYLNNGSDSWEDYAEFNQPAP